MAQNVVADPNFGIARILRPYPNFEDVYQGQAADIPIMLSEGGAVLDGLAESSTSGYDPQLVSGLSVPFGSRVVLYIPFISWFSGRDLIVIGRYQWRILWRLRNVFDYRNARIPYHYPKQSPGISDTFPVPPAIPKPRVVIPAAMNSVVYAGQEPTQQLNGTFLPADQAIYVEQLLSPNFQYLKRPLNGLDNLGAVIKGTIMQGIADPGSPYLGDMALVPGYIVHEVQAVGDEMLLCARRIIVDTAPVWNFVELPVPGADFMFSLGLGKGDKGGVTYPDVGVYAFVGSAP